MFGPFRKRRDETDSPVVTGDHIHCTLHSLVRVAREAGHLEFLPTRRSKSRLSGRNRSMLRGRGLDFQELRNYRLGDDIRSMDWKATRRTGKPHVKVFSEEKERTTSIVVDQRMSMFFGSTGQMKSVVAAQVAAITACQVIDAGDRVGGFIFGDTEIDEHRPVGTERGVMRILQAIADANSRLAAGPSRAEPDPNMLARVFRHLNRVASHDNMVIVVTDWSGWNDLVEKELVRLSSHNDVIGILVSDPVEKSLPASTSLVMGDGDRQIRVDSGKQRLTERQRQSFDDFYGTLNRGMAKARAPFLEVSTVEPVIGQLAGLANLLSLQGGQR